MSTTLEDFTLIKLLGDGYSGSVMLAKETCNSDPIALKFPSPEKLKKSPKIVQMLLREYNTLSKITHPNIVKPVKYLESATLLREKGKGAFEVPCLALELVPNGEVYELISSKGCMSHEITLYLFSQLMKTIEYIHSCGYSHGDIKPENMLLDSEFSLKLIDFAFSRPLESCEGQVNGTPGYLAPEIYSKKSYDLAKADVFAAGVVLFVIARGMPPFNESHSQDFHFRALSQYPDQFWKYHFSKAPNGLNSREFVELITKMLCFDPVKRFSVEQVLAHPFMATPFDEEKARRSLKAMKGL